MQDTLDILKAHDAVGSLHCYQGSAEMAQEFIKLGFYIGIGGPITHTNNKKIRKMVKDEKMENIRVLIKNSNFDGYYHEKIEGVANVDMELVYGQESFEIAAGESFSIYPDSEYFSANRIYLKPKALTGRTTFHNIDRNNGGQGYYGTFELEKREEKLYIIGHFPD